MIPRTFKCPICSCMNCWKRLKAPEYNVECANCGYVCHLWECQLFTGKSDRNEFKDVTKKSTHLMKLFRQKYLSSLEEPEELIS